MKKVTINKEQNLYVIPCGNGFSCLGFDVLMRKAKNLADELGLTFKAKKGTLNAYFEYSEILAAASKKHLQTGWRSKSELFAPFIGNEGKRVEVIYTHGEVQRFTIGKSTGFIPCHLIIKRSNSTGGEALLPQLIQSFKFIN